MKNYMPLVADKDRGRDARAQTSLYNNPPAYASVIHEEIRTVT